MYVTNGLNKFLTPLPGTEKFLSGSTRSLAYTGHIIQFGLNNYPFGELCEIGVKTKQKNGKSANTATTCSRGYYILKFSSIR